MYRQRFAVEFDRRVVGIAVRAPGGFTFFASDRDFGGLDGRIFPHSRAIARALERQHRRRRRRLEAQREYCPSSRLRLHRPRLQDSLV